MDLWPLGRHVCQAQRGPVWSPLLRSLQKSSTGAVAVNSMEMLYVD